MEVCPRRARFFFPQLPVPSLPKLQCFRLKTARTFGRQSHVAACGGVEGRRGPISRVRRRHLRSLTLHSPAGRSGKLLDLSKPAPHLRNRNDTAASLPGAACTQLRGHTPAPPPQAVNTSRGAERPVALEIQGWAVPKAGYLTLNLHFPNYKKQNHDAAKCNPSTWVLSGRVFLKSQQRCPHSVPADRLSAVCGDLCLVTQ